MPEFEFVKGLSHYTDKKKTKRKPKRKSRGKKKKPIKQKISHTFFF